MSRTEPRWLECSVVGTSSCRKLYLSIGLATEKVYMKVDNVPRRKSATKHHGRAGLQGPCCCMQSHRNIGNAGQIYLHRSAKEGEEFQKLAIAKYDGQKNPSAPPKNYIQYSPYKRDQRTILLSFLVPTQNQLVVLEFT